MKTNILINNELIQGDSTPEKIINPVNSELIVEVPQSSEEQVNKIGSFENEKSKHIKKKIGCYLKHKFGTK